MSPPDPLTTKVGELVVGLEDGATRPATDDERAAYATHLRRMAAPRGVGLEERARAARDRKAYAALHARHAELLRRTALFVALLEERLAPDQVAELERALEHELAKRGDP
ncbi:MAG: hypothetical protein H6736_17125 [Alphaproteobacteria bacterium]|nr:hypothetical protein [Alphaproteobacteria bacterium]